MIPVDQLIVPDRFDQVHHGDCLRACLASLLELPAASVPHVYDYDGSDGTLGNDRLQAWLHQRGLGYLETRVPVDLLPEYARHFLRGYHVLIGMGGIVPHAVVAYKGLMVHDPHPFRKGVTPLPPEEGVPEPTYIVGVLILLCGAAPSASVGISAETV